MCVTVRVDWIQPRIGLQMNTVFDQGFIRDDWHVILLTFVVVLFGDVVWQHRYVTLCGHGEARSKVRHSNHASRTCKDCCTVAEMGDGSGSREAAAAPRVLINLCRRLREKDGSGEEYGATVESDVFKKV